MSLRRIRIICFAWVGLLAGCDKPTPPAGANANQPRTNTNPKVATLSNPGAIPNTNSTIPGMQASPLDTTNIARAYLARGAIRNIPPDHKSVTIKHEDIPGLMPRMTMEFDLRDTNELNGFSAGDLVTFTVRADANESWIEGLKHAGTNDPTAVLPSDPSSTALLHVAKLKPGDEMPDAELLSEDGNVVKLSHFKGKAVAFTFIFTRCPLPDFCPRMSQHFSKAREILEQNANGPRNWEFISISFDPEFDKPGVLSRYAFSYRGKNTNQWLFAAAPPHVLSAFTSELDFRFANENGSFLHNLRTIVLNTTGRIHRQFDGNRWTAQDLANAMTAAAMPPQ